ncbi:MAG: hypothetical protein KGL39_09390 [Patescibacteria group bacterium]|nr:hypothetical protein [Patescibacteria group bacterium]
MAMDITRFIEDTQEVDGGIASAIVDIEAGPEASPEYAHERFDEVTDISATEPSTALGSEAVMPTLSSPALQAASLPTHRFVKPRHCAHCTGGEADRAQKVIVGGVEYAFGGWGQYEVERRRARWDVRRFKPGELYGQRKYLGGADVAAKMLASGPLRKSLENLVETLGKVEDKLCDATGDGTWECLPTSALEQKGASPGSWATTVPALTSADVRAFIEEPERLAIVDDLEDLADSVNVLAASVGLFLDELPPLASKHEIPRHASRTVRVSDDEAVLKLEADTVPYISGVEKYQAALAARIDKVTRELARKMKK